MPADYVPQRGDFIWLQHNPQAGHEQAGHRPALVLSSQSFAQKTSMAMVCPITNTKRPWPLHIPIEHADNITGAVMCDQAKCLDWRVRNAAFIETAPPSLVQLVQATVTAIVQQ